jgi:hypothetical protein
MNMEFMSASHMLHTARKLKPLRPNVLSEAYPYVQKHTHKIKLIKYIRERRVISPFSLKTV